MRLLSEDDVAALIDRPMVLAAMQEAYRMHSAGELYPPARNTLRADDGRFGALNLAALARDGMLCVKTNTFSFSGINSPRKAESLVTLWHAQTSEAVAMMSARLFNQHRTAAGLAVAIGRLAAADATRLVLFGAGFMATETLRYALAARPFRHVQIFGRTASRVRTLVQTAQGWPEASGVSISVGTDVATALMDADTVIAITTTTDPVISGACLRPGTLVVLGGANRHTAREADDTLMARATVYADHLDGCLDQAGDIVQALGSGALRREQLAGEIGTLFDADPALQVATPMDLIVFKSIGVATQDLVLAQRLVERAIARGIGQDFPPPRAAAVRVAQ
ncbi:MAG TPA: hypothetical protein VGC31_07320 [Paenirhodobacter sp.]